MQAESWTDAEKKASKTCVSRDDHYDQYSKEMTGSKDIGVNIKFFDEYFATFSDSSPVPLPSEFKKALARFQKQIFKTPETSLASMAYLASDNTGKGY